MSITSEVDHAMTRAIEENDVTALGVVLELRPEVDRALSNLSLQGADGPSGVRPLQLACHKASWACALELVRRGADGIGCADADGDAPLILAFAKGGAEAWTVASAIMAAEAERAGVPEPMDDHTAQYLAAQQAPRRRVVGEKVEMGTAKELWTRVSNKGLSLHTVFFTKLHEVGPHTPCVTSPTPSCSPIRSATGISRLRLLRFDSSILFACLWLRIEGLTESTHVARCFQGVS